MKKVSKEKLFRFYTSVDEYTKEDASSLEEFIEKVRVIDSKSLEFHLYRQDFEKWFNNFFLGKCSIAGKYMSVIENGDVIPCSFNDRIRLGNVQNKSLNQIWDELQLSKLTLKLRNRDNLKGKCGVCEYREICGGCRTRAEIYSGNIFASDPACAYIPKSLQ